MKTIATCARCGETRELCDSPRIDGIKLPRYCKPCIVDNIADGCVVANDDFYMRQLEETCENASITLLVEERTR